MTDVPSMTDGRSGGPDEDPVMLLSPRQMEVMQALSEGLTRAQTGQRIGISRSTVNDYASSAFRVLGVRSEAAAVLRFAALGWLRLPSTEGEGSVQEMLERIGRLLEQLVEAIGERGERGALTGGQRAYLKAFEAWFRNPEDDEQLRAMRANLTVVLERANRQLSEP